MDVKAVGSLQPKHFQQGPFLAQPWFFVLCTGFPGKPVGMKNHSGSRASKCTCQSNSKFLGTQLPHNAVGESPAWKCMPVIPARGNGEKDP